MKIKALFLYAEIMSYTEGVIINYLSKNPSIEISFVQLDKKKLTKFIPKIQHINKSSFNSFKAFKSYCISYNPNALFVSGRMDKDYLKITKYFKGSIPTITVQDTLFENSLRQKLISVFSKLLYRQYFDFFWGVGSLQTAFALKMGFKKNQIFEFFYIHNSTVFNNQVTINKVANKLKIICIGRLAEEKNFLTLARAVDELNLNGDKNISITIIGEGPERENLSKYKFVNLLGYMEPDKILENINGYDLFCLPSLYEPWGLVVNEMTSIGFPILASNNCGSAFNLVIENYNGLKFDPNNIDELKKKLLNFLEFDKSNFKSMSKNSIQLSKEFTFEKWEAIFNTIIEKS